MDLKFTSSLWVLACLQLVLSNDYIQAQTVSDQTALIPSPRQSFTPTPPSVRGYWNIDVVGDFNLPATKSITFSGAGRNLHVNQDWSKLFRRGFSSIDKSRMTPEEIRIDFTPANSSPSWRSRLTQEQRAVILYQNYFTSQPFNLQWAKNSELARYMYFQQPAGSATPRQSMGSAMAELTSGCVLFNDCPSSGPKSTFGKIYFDIENEGTPFENRQEHANFYAYKMWALRNVISPTTQIGGIGPIPHNSFGYSRSSDYQVTTTDWLWSTTAQHLNETDTRGRGMPDAIVGKSFGDQADFAMPHSYFLSSELNYSAPHNGDEDRHWLASLLGEQEVNLKLTSKKRIAWQWLFNTQSNDPGQASRAEHPAPPVIAEGLAIFYWFTGAYGALFWDDWDALTPNAPVVPGRENLDNNRNYACYEHYIHGLWRLFKHHGDMFNGGEKYINDQTECSYDGGRTWYRLNANALKRSGMPFVRAIVNGNQILVAATNAYASANTQKQVMIRYVQDNYRFYSTINLTGDEIYLGRATMPTGNSSFTPSSTEISSVTTPTNPSGGSLAATVISYNCATGAIVFGKTGGSIAATEYLAIGITGWSAETIHYVESGLRADPKPIPIRIRQIGVEGTPYVFDLKGYCSGSPQTPTNTAPTVMNLVNTQVATAGANFGLNVGSVFTDAQTPGQLFISVSNLPAGLSLSGNSIIGTPQTSGANTIILTATDPGGLQVSTTFLLTVNANNPGGSGSTINPPMSQPLAATVLYYHCPSGVIVLGKTGGDSSPVEYFSMGITGWTTSNMHMIEARLRADPKPITIRIRQNGVEGTAYVLDLRAYCGITTTPSTPVNTAPTLANRVSAHATTVGVGYNQHIGSMFTDAETPNQLVLTVTGLPAGLSFSNNVITGTPTVLGVHPIYIVATDPGGLMSSSGYVLTVSAPIVTAPLAVTSIVSGCGSPANTVGQPLQVVGVQDVNCVNGTFRIMTMGGNGTDINYANVVGLNNSDQNNCVRSLVNVDLLVAVNNPASTIGPFQIRTSQSGITSNTFSFNYKQYCTGAARVAQTNKEIAPELSVRLLGNPSVDEWAVLEVEGTNEEPVTFRVLDIQGREVGHQQAEPSTGTIRHRVWLGRSPGIRMVQISTSTRTKMVKVVKQ